MILENQKKYELSKKDNDELNKAYPELADEKVNTLVLKMRDKYASDVESVSNTQDGAEARKMKHYPVTTMRLEGEGYDENGNVKKYIVTKQSVVPEKDGTYSVKRGECLVIDKGQISLNGKTQREEIWLLHNFGGNILGNVRDQKRKRENPVSQEDIYDPMFYIYNQGREKKLALDAKLLSATLVAKVVALNADERLALVQYLVPGYSSSDEDSTSLVAIEYCNSHTDKVNTYFGGGKKEVVATKKAEAEAGVKDDVTDTETLSDTGSSPVLKLVESAIATHVLTVDLSKSSASFLHNAKKVIIPHTKAADIADYLTANEKALEKLREVSE